MNKTRHNCNNPEYCGYCQEGVGADGKDVNMNALQTLAGHSLTTDDCVLDIYVDASTIYIDNDRRDSRICVATDNTVLTIEDIGDFTVNEAEMIVIAKALDIAEEQGFFKRPVRILSDSKLAVSMINGEWEGKKPHLQYLANKVNSKESFKEVSLQWIARDKNKAGHALDKDRAYKARFNHLDERYSKFFK